MAALVHPTRHLQHTAAWYLWPRVTKWLLTNGKMDPNIKTLKGNTALHLVCEHGDRPDSSLMMKMLLIVNADTFVHADVSGKVPRTRRTHSSKYAPSINNKQYPQLPPQQFSQ
jgi:hypothetical protein